VRTSISTDQDCLLFLYRTKLQVGDVLYRLGPDGKSCIQIPICSISYERAACATVHGLHFSRGGNGGRYYANGYWVGENYPDITIHSLLHRFSSLTAHEQHAFTQTVRDLPHSFRKVFGSIVFDAFRGTFGHPFDAMSRWLCQSKLDIAAMENAMPQSVNIKKLVATYRLLSATHLADRKPFLDSTHPRYLRLVEHINEGAQFPIITLFKGSVFCDGQAVQSASMTKTSLTWSREITDSVYSHEHGLLRIIAHGKAVVGILAEGEASWKHLSDLHRVRPFFAVADANDYELLSRPKWSTSTGAADEESKYELSNGNPFWKVRIGFAKHNGGMELRAVLPELDDECENRDAEPTRLYSVAPVSLDVEHATLKFDIRVTSGMEQAFQQYIMTWTSTDRPGPAFETCTLLFDLQSNELHGHYREMVVDDDGTAVDGPVHALHCTHSDTLEAASAIHWHSIHDSENMEPLDHSGTVHDPSRLFHRPTTLAHREGLARLFENDMLSIGELQTMPWPSDNDVLHLAHTYLEQCASRWQESAEKHFLGSQHPASKRLLHDDHALTDNLDENDHAFLGQYSRAIVYLGLAQHEEFKSKFSEEEHAALKFFWQGTAEGCLSQSKTFNKLWRVAVSEAFKTLTPWVKPYLRDPQDWRSGLFIFASHHTALDAQAFSMFQHSQHNSTERFCSILGVLDPESRGLEARLWRLVRQKLLLHPATGTIATRPQDWCGFATLFAKLLIERIESGVADHAILRYLAADLKELIGIMFTSSPSELAHAMFGSESPLGQCLEMAIGEQGGVAARNGLAGFPALMAQFSNTVKERCSIFTKASNHMLGFCALS
jgi:hypothetical protein